MKLLFTVVLLGAAIAQDQVSKARDLYRLRSVSLDNCFAFCVSSKFDMITVGALPQIEKLYSSITKIPKKCKQSQKV